MKLSAKQSERTHDDQQQVGSKRTAIGHSHDSPVNPNKKIIMMDKDGNDCALSTAAGAVLDSTTNSIPPHSGIFSSDRKSSKAFLLILSDKKCQFRVSTKLRF